MSYGQKPRRSVAGDVERIVERQLALAIDQLRTIGSRRRDGRIHQARRDVKKVRRVRTEPARPKESRWRRAA